jgi:hypothetical protein
LGEDLQFTVTVIRLETDGGTELLAAENENTFNVLNLMNFKDLPMHKYNPIWLRSTLDSFRTSPLNDATEREIWNRVSFTSAMFPSIS